MYDDDYSGPYLKKFAIPFCMPFMAKVCYSLLQAVL